MAGSRIVFLSKEDDMLDGKASGCSTDSGLTAALRQRRSPERIGKEREGSWASIKVPGCGCWRIR
jgi:hypothetical protein